MKPLSTCIPNGGAEFTLDDFYWILNESLPHGAEAEGPLRGVGSGYMDAANFQVTDNWNVAIMRRS